MWYSHKYLNLENFWINDFPKRDKSINKYFFFDYFILVIISISCGLQTRFLIILILILFWLNYQVLLTTTLTLAKISLAFFCFLVRFRILILKNSFNDYIMQKYHVSVFEKLNFNANTLFAFFSYYVVCMALFILLDLALLDFFSYVRIYENHFWLLIQYQENLELLHQAYDATLGQPNIKLKEITPIDFVETEIN